MYVLTKQARSQFTLVTVAARAADVTVPSEFEATVPTCILITNHNQYFNHSAAQHAYIFIVVTQQIILTFTLTPRTFIFICTFFTKYVMHGRSDSM